MRHLFRRPSLWIAAGITVVLLDVVALGHTIIPLTLPSVTPSGPAGYRGAGVNAHAITVDPAAAMDIDSAWLAYAVMCARQGTLPFWNPYQGIGQPHLANYVSAPLYPPSWLALLLPRRFWDFLNLLSWFLSALFVYLAARVLTIGKQGALVAAMAVLASGYFEGYLAARVLVEVTIWTPYLIYAVERSLRQPTWRWRYLALATGAAGLATGGHPTPAILGLGFVVGFAAVRALATRRGRWFVGVIAAIALGGLAAAPVWLVFAGNVLVDGTAVHGTEVGALHFPLATLPGFALPFIYGPLNFDPWLGQFSALTWLPASAAFLALAGMMDLIARRRRAALVVLGGLTVLLIAKVIGVPGINQLGSLPFLNQTSFLYGTAVIAVGLAIFAGAGFESLRRRPVYEWRVLFIVWGMYIATMAICGAWVMTAGRPFAGIGLMRPLHLGVALASGLGWSVAFPAALTMAKQAGADRSKPMWLVALSGLLLQAAACFPSGSDVSFLAVNGAAATAFVAVAALVWRRGAHLRGDARVFCLVMGATALVVLTTVIRPRLPDRDDWLRTPAFVTFIQQVPNAARVYPLDGVLFPNFAAPFGLSSVTNLESLVTRNTPEFFRRFLDSGVLSSRFYGMPEGRLAEKPTAVDEFWRNKAYWDFIGVEYVLTSGRRIDLDSVYESPAPSPTLIPIKITSPLEMRVPCASGPFTAVGVRLSTYARVSNGVVTIEVTDASGGVSIRADAAAFTLADNEEHQFALPAAACAWASGDATVRLSFQLQRPTDAVAAWQHPEWSGAGFVMRALRARSGRQALTLAFRDDQTGVAVWKNPTASARVFLAPEVRVAVDGAAAMSGFGELPGDRLQRTAFVEDPNACAGSAQALPVGEPGGRLNTLTIGPNQVDIDYTAAATGLLTMTDAYAKGWRAFVDGREGPVVRVDSVFRGVCLAEPGRHHVMFTYRPPLWNTALILCVLGVAGIAVGTVSARRPRARSANSAETR